MLYSTGPYIGGKSLTTRFSCFTCTLNVDEVKKSGHHENTLGDILIGKSEISIEKCILRTFFDFLKFIPNVPGWCEIGLRVS